MTGHRPPEGDTGADPSGRQGGRLGAALVGVAPDGVRVVLDVRPLQEPDRAPLTATYLGCLLAAFAEEPLAGESFTVLFQAGLPDPTESLAGLAVAGRRALPPTRLLGSGALTLDPFLLRTAAFGAAWRAGRSGAAGAVYHATSGAAPLLSGLPLVVTLLDLAPWELPQAYQRSPAARFGQRLRGQILRDAKAVIVPTEASARDARRLLHLRPERLHVVPLAPRPAFRAGADEAILAAERERLGLPERYFVYAGRYDARQDLATLLRALARLQAAHDGERAATAPAVSDSRALRAGRAASSTAVLPLPRVLLVGATPDDRAALARAAAREGVGELLAYAPRLDDAVLAALVAGARAVILPVVSESAGLAAIEAIASGVPVIASAVGGLPEIVGSAGILVEPRDPARLSVALEAAWADNALHGRMADAAAQRAITDRRTWSDVALDTRRVYADAVAARKGRSAT